MLLIFFYYIFGFYFPQWWWSLEREGPIYKGKERKNSNVCLPYKIIFQLLVILFIIKLYARVNIFRLSEDLQPPPEICDSSKMHFLVKRIFFFSFQIETFMITRYIHKTLHIPWEWPRPKLVRKIVCFYQCYIYISVCVYSVCICP